MNLSVYIPNRKQRGGKSDVPFASLNRKGVLSLNKVASTMLGNTKKVVLYFDGAAMKIGVCASKSENDLTVSVYHAAGIATINLADFVDRYSLQNETGYRYPVHKSDDVEGMLIIDLADSVGEIMKTGRK